MERKVGFTCSCFDLFHAGHIMMLKEAKSVCDYLIVGLQSDPTLDRPEKNKPVQSIVERFIQLDACKYVDEIVVYATEKDLMDVLLSYPINVRIVGDEYADVNFTGKNLQHIEIYYCQLNLYIIRHPPPLLQILELDAQPIFLSFLFRHPLY
jgi:glycerol-3-phosphate cytidylyltransferase